MTERIRFKTGVLNGIELQAAHAWNRVNDLRDQRDKNPESVSRDEIERAALDWFEKSAKAGREAMRR